MSDIESEQSFIGFSKQEKKIEMDVNDIHEFLKYCLALPGFYFRGQSRSSWDLVPSLARINNPRSNHDRVLFDWEQLEEHLYEEFKRQATPHLNISLDSKLEWMVHAQHHGLPTRLLDWTTNPLKALFFAIENKDYDDFDSAVYSCIPDTAVSFNSLNEMSSITRVEFFDPPHLNSRIIAQEGCFSILPIPANFDSFTPVDEISDKNVRHCLTKFIIKKENKSEIRRNLIKLGISHNSIYPNLDGICKSIVYGFD